MKLAVIGDIHASHNNIKDTLLGMNNLINILDDKEVQYLLISGDVFHDFNIGGKESSFGSVFDSINTPLNDFLSKGIKRKIIMIPGNHDMSTDKNQKNALVSFDYKPRIFVSHNIQNYNLGEGVNIITLPWMYPSMYKNKEDIKLLLQSRIETNKDGFNILLGHCQIEGTDLPNNHVVFGGDFTFTRDEIDSFGFDIIALGHIHKQQEYYTGTPWQHDFGESSLIGSIRIIDIYQQAIFEDEIVEIPNTAKYYNIDVKFMDVFKCRKIDYVKIKGKQLPDKKLPNNYIFEKEKEIATIKSRTDASITDSIETLLSKYIKDKGIKTDIKELVKILKDIDIDNIYLPQGSLNKFNSLTLTNIGPHKNTHIDFKDPILAISGENGVGKTILLESMFAALYGKFPSYGKISNISDDGKIETVLTTDSGEYRIVRKINKNKNTAFIYKDNKALVGPKVGEVNKYIEKLIGPEELLLSSVFSTQFSYGDIVDLDPSERKNIFHKLLGLNFILDIKEKIDSKLDKSNGKKELMLNKLNINNIDDLNNAINTSKKEFIKTSDILKTNNTLLQKHNIELQKPDSTKQYKKIEIIQKQYDKLTNQLKEKSNKMSELLDITNEEHLHTKKYNEQNNKITRKIEYYDNLIKSLKDEKAKLNDVGCKDNLLSCKFIKSAVDAEDKIKKLEHKKDVWLKDENKILLKLNLAKQKCLENKNKCTVPQVDEKEHTHLESKLSELKNENNIRITKLNVKIDTIKNTITQNKILLAETKKDLQLYQSKIVDYLSLETEIKKITSEISKISLLSKAFSGNGIPQLIINSALPQLQDILNILTKYISKYSIHISTQEELKSGNVKETISFLIDDGVKKRDVKYYSGGEKKLLKSLIRLSLSIFQTQRTNRNYKTLFMDEAFDALDKNNALHLLKILYNLSDRFNQIFIVSHFTDILYNFTNCIKLKKKSNKTIINEK